MELVSKNTLDKLIDLDGQTDSNERRAILREVTDALMVAPDRYGRRETVYFDLLLSRCAQAMDDRVRRILAMALVRSGAREEHVRTALRDIPSPNGRFLRRSVTQTRADLLCFLQENTEPAPTTELVGDPAFSDGNSLTLPTLIREALYLYLTSQYCNAIAPKIGKDRTQLLQRTTARLQAEVVTAAEETAREEITIARRTVQDWTRRQAITDDLLADLLEARAMTEFIFALMARFDLDTATTLRMLNDASFESLAIMARSQNVRRSVFAKTVMGFRNRRTDDTQTNRILSYYEKLPQEAADRAVRFWRVRISDMSGGTVNSEASAFAASTLLKDAS